MGLLQDKVMVITGGSRGLGLAVARAAAAEGARVVLASRSADAVDAAVGGLRAAGHEASGIACDVSDLAQEYKGAGVGIYAINPGMMTTDFLTDLQAVCGCEGRLKVMPTIIRMWARPPEAPAQKVVWLASSATDGKTGLVLSQMGPAQMLGGALREGLRRLLRRPEPPLDMKVAVIPAALPLPNRRGPALEKKW